jgi:hypothetical protein
MVEGRADLLDGILADSFTALHITGYVSPKAEWVDQIRSGDFVYHSIRDSAPHQRTDREGRTVTVGRKILRTIAVMTAVGGFVVDWNRTHLFNPSWPPHARFHDAMTITLGTFLGGSALYFLRDGAGRRDVAIGALLLAFFWTSMGTAFTFPGTAGMEAGSPSTCLECGACGSTSGTPAPS